MNPLKKLRSLNEKIRKRQAALGKAEHERNEFFARYCEERPLKKEERSRLADYVESGGALCCENGAKYLRTVFPEIWAELINDWAYEKLDCCIDTAEDRAEKSKKVRLLQCDMPPPGTPGYEIAKTKRNL